MTQPLVSVIIPTFNRDTFLMKAIESVVNQTYSEIEILVIDDGSERNYAEAICQNFEACTYHYKPNGGLSSARNFGIKKANGAYIAFLDDDDYWREDKIERQLEAFNAHPEVALVHSAAAVVDEAGVSTGEIIGAMKGKEHLRSGKVFWNALGTWVVKSPTPLIRSAVLKDFLFDETIKVGEDVDFYQRFFYYHQIFYIPEPLAYYRIYDSSDRLTANRGRYIGMEQKMWRNFQQMSIGNPWVKHKIAQRILRFAIYNWNQTYPDNSVKIPKFNAVFRPQFSLRTYFNPPE